MAHIQTVQIDDQNMKYFKFLVEKGLIPPNLTKFVNLLIHDEIERKSEKYKYDPLVKY